MYFAIMEFYRVVWGQGEKIIILGDAKVEWMGTIEGGRIRIGGEFV